jgi:hypothetical protein
LKLATSTRSAFNTVGQDLLVIYADCVAFVDGKTLFTSLTPRLKALSDGQDLSGSYHAAWQINKWQLTGQTIFDAAICGTILLALSYSYFV